MNPESGTQIAYFLEAKDTRKLTKFYEVSKWRQFVRYGMLHIECESLYDRRTVSPCSMVVE